MDGIIMDFIGRLTWVKLVDGHQTVPLTTWGAQRRVRLSGGVPIFFNFFSSSKFYSNHVYARLKLRNYLIGVC